MSYLVSGMVAKAHPERRPDSRARMASAPERASFPDLGVDGIELFLRDLHDNPSVGREPDAVDFGEKAPRDEPKRGFLATRGRKEVSILDEAMRVDSAADDLDLVFAEGCHFRCSWRHAMMEAA
jgi:hypothetical protein